MVEQHIGVVGSTFGFNVAAIAGRKLVNLYLNGYYDEVHIIYAEFFSMAKQIPMLKQLLPIPPLRWPSRPAMKMHRTWPNISRTVARGSVG